MLNEYKAFITLDERGRVEMKYGHIHLVILNIEELKLEGEDGLLLSIFCKELDEKPKKYKLPYKKTVDVLVKIFNMRLLYFEGVKPMGAVADITEYVKPKLEEARAEGKAKDKAEGRAEVALGMLNKGYSLSDISDLTGLSAKEINKLR